MSKTPLMISVAGVRGVVGDSLTADVVLRWASAFGALCKPGPIVVGGDSRISKTMVRAATIAGLADAGCSIIDVSVTSTPTIALAVEHHHAKGGIAITASHNPAEWNALKFYNHQGLFLDEVEGNKLRQLAESNTKFSLPASEIGTYKKDEEAEERHIETVLKIPFLKLAEIRKRKFRVGLDAVNGAGGTLLSTLLKELGCEVIGFHLEPTGKFPRNPEPLPENLVGVCSAMKAGNVDIGFVVDPDADRLAVILENGKPAGEELTLVAATDLTLKYLKGPVVANCSTTRALDDIAAKYGQTVTRTKVGEAHVARKMHELGAVIGGEGNGGVMLASVHAARDTVVGVALILQQLLESEKTASQYFASLPQYVMVKKRKEFSDLNVLKKSIEFVSEKSPFGNPDKLDGLKWSFNDSWVQLRASNTEPIARIFAEAKTESQAEQLTKQILELMETAV